MKTVLPILLLVTMTATVCGRNCGNGLTHFWLSPNENQPYFADVPYLNSASPIPLYVWARLEPAQSITDLSLELSTTGTAVLSGAELDNPTITIQAPLPNVRFEDTTSELVTDNLVELHGFTLRDSDRLGVGFGADTSDNDPMYDSSSNAWRVGELTVSGGEGSISLRVGRNGIQGIDAAGETTPVYSVVFGDESDEPLCALDERHSVSSRPDALIDVGTIDGSSIGNLSGSYIQDPSGSLMLHLSSVPWLIAGGATLGGQLVIDSGGSLPPRGMTEETELISATEITGTFDELIVDGHAISTTDHQSDGIFRWLEYDATSVNLLTYHALVGDADGNRTVEFADFLILSSNFGLPGEWEQGNFDDDGLVAFADFLGLSGNFGLTAVPIQNSTPRIENVPEANSAWLEILSILLIIHKLCGRTMRIPG